LANLNGTPAGFAASGSTVADDPSTTDCDESLLLLRKPDGTIQYKALNTVDPSGINGQSVYMGGDGADRVFGGNDNDTFWGGAGNDVIEGGGGDDVALGGDGNDIITDLSGADVLKGGPGNDAIDGGIGDDILLGADGQDFINGGANDNESFAGPGNDFIIAGQGADAVFGDGGDDWIEGGTGQDLLQGDHGAPFFDDPAQVAPGNDIFIGQPGENDYDAEGGDDVMSQNAAIDRNAGAGGFDWAFHQYDTVGGDDDMEINNNLVGLPIQVVVNRDRWQETEADSGSQFNDSIKGTSVAPSSIGGAGFTGCDAIDQAGLNRINGLDPLVPALTTDPAPIAAASAPGQCPLSGNVWGDGDVLLGGLGSDTIEGRGANDILDGDRYLQVRISVRTNPADPTTEIGTTDLMEGKAKVMQTPTGPTPATGNFGPGTTNMTLQQAVFAGLVDPGNLVAVREIITPAAGPADCDAAAPVNCDTAVFSGPQAGYQIVNVAAAAPSAADPGGRLASVRVTDNRAVPTDGVDTLRNFEQLSFCPTPGATRGTCAVARTIVRVAPKITVTPATLTAFAATALNGTSAAKTITVGNTGFADLTASLAFSGPDAGSFAATGCTAPVPGGTSCVVSVTFKPTSLSPTAAKSATLTITSNDPVTPTKTFAVSGTAVDPIITLTPSAVTFATQNVGTNSAAQTIVVKNTGAAAVTTSPVVLGGANPTQFTITNPASTCVTGRALAAGVSCNITVRFNPTGTTSGSRAATLTVVSSTGSSFAATLTGTAATPPTIAALTNIAFGRHPINSTTTTTETVRNSGIDPLIISSVAVSGLTSAPTTVSLNTCVDPVAAGATCQLIVTFHPTVAVNSTATVTITSNASNNPRTFQVTGRT
ncbi:MAG TPA: choice-of-anchor D domain-containing protein, partial [Ilumatobacteraceae bacterium]